MASQVHLPVIQQDNRVPRRRVLLIGAAAAGTVACRADFDIGFGVTPPDDSGNPNQQQGGDDSGPPYPDDTGSVPPADAAMNPGQDATTYGPDMATQPPMDSGQTYPPDATAPQEDTYVPPQDVPPPPPTCTAGPGSMVGTTAMFPQGTWTELQSPTIVVAQDASGLYAYTSICTHQGCPCDPPDSTGTMTCPCHGSVFDGNGAVVNGPARRALAHYALSVCNGDVYVDTSTTVAATTRTPPA